MARKRINKVPSKPATFPGTGFSPFNFTKAGQNGCFISVLACGAFVFLFSLIAITSFIQKSPTVDEPVHLLSGYSYLKWGDFRSNPEHPPLAKMLAALPLMVFDIKDPRPSSPHWDLIPAANPLSLHTIKVAAQMLFVENDAETLFFYAKLMMIALALVLGLFVFKWSRDLFGLGAAIVSLFVYALDPNILAHSQLVHTDLPFTATFFIATYFFYRTLNRLNLANLIFTILFFSLAAITKWGYTVILLAWAILGAVHIFSSQRQELAIGISRTVSDRWGKTVLLAAVFACALMTAYVFIWAAYGFRFDAIPGGKLHLPMAEELPQSAAAKALVTFLIQYHLFPEAWIYGQLHILNNLGRDAYLFGQMSFGHGKWLYFPVAFAVKTPLPTLLLLLATLVLWILDRNQRKAETALFIPVVVYFSLAVWSGMNIGLRHILPIYPFLFVIVGGTAIKLWQAKTRMAYSILAVLCAWYIVSSVVTYPSYLTFFNEIAGGARNGHKILLDSNLDWGQDLKGLKAWMVRHDVQNVQFLYFGFYDIAAPRYYGINAFYLPGSWVGSEAISPESPQRPDYLAISANHLYGYFHGGRDEGFVKPFQSADSLAIIGNSILVYSLDRAISQYRNIVQANSGSADSHYKLANLLNHRGDSEQAIQEYRRAIQIDPEFAEAHDKLSIALLKTEALEEAIRHLRRVLALTPLKNRHETQFWLGAALVKQGHVREAENYFKEAIKTQPGFAPAYYNLGILSAAQGEVYRAIEYFTETLMLDPQNAEAHASLARALAEQGGKKEAAKHLQEAIRILKTQRKSMTDASPPPRS
jgi:tetratricopeptide (TPR) repeat protein